MDEDFGDDADFAAVAASVERSDVPRQNGASKPKVQQPKPQALPSRSAASSILVSTRQKGNPSLNYIKSLPWEYSDIPADYVLGATTCALFLSLKYHRLHPEYIYSRIKALGHKYNLRVLLTMVDIQNHEESLKELSKTSLINNLTLILCWSAQEAGRYLELYKSYEHASPTSIRAHQSTSYSEKLVDFITVPRSVNKTDAVSIVSAFGSIRAAINARPEEIGEITGWGEKKVQRWCSTVRENFRVKKATRRGIGREGSSIGLAREESSMGVVDEEAEVRGAEPIPIGSVPVRQNAVASLRNDAHDAHSSRPRTANGTLEGPPKRLASQVPFGEPDEDDEEALIAAAEEDENFLSKLKTNNKSEATNKSQKALPKSTDALNEGVAAALAKLRKE
ncbi:uncharacterized protein KY384_002249 [Bacidia gigantensis]|uniref:uncharacterized protein n=1 Tax=Bacidia gigantensis TaxID=2732470 RepID=UPI001D055A70|nr:uncharacterized protein KY384_002249 [Bacidia gigantensis]KAG8533466.1 hypothetical protein KY384_002249 [Bacidia gigantensis]